MNENEGGEPGDGDARAGRQRKNSVKSVNQLTAGGSGATYDTGRFDESQEGPAERVWLMANLDLYDQDNRQQAARILRRAIDADARQQADRTSRGKIWTAILLMFASAAVTLAAKLLPRIWELVVWIATYPVLPPHP